MTNETTENDAPANKPERMPGTDEQPFKPSTNYYERKKELNAKIMEITMKIRDEYPELLKYLDEVLDTIPDEKHPDRVLMDLKSYYDSLCEILKKYKEEHPQ